MKLLVPIYSKIFSICLLVIIFFAHHSFVNAEIKEGEVYKKDDKSYVNIGGQVYGPYEMILDVQVEGKNWGFIYSDQKFHSTSSGYYNVLMNGKKYGPFYKDYSMSMPSILVTEKHYGFIGTKEAGEYYLNIDGNEQADCEAPSLLKITANNYGFICYSGKDRSVVVINGEKYNEDGSIMSFDLTAKQWGYTIKGDDEYFVRINGDKFGPYENVYDVNINAENWGFAYLKDGSYYVLSNLNPPYRLPFSKEQGEIDPYGLFYSRELYVTPQQCHVDCPQYGKNKLIVGRRYWSLLYSIDGVSQVFTNNELFKRLLGRIVLQVEKNGEAYYVDPSEARISYLGNPAKAYELMRKQGIGISENDFNKLEQGVSARLSGRILLRVEKNGEAYYISPKDKKVIYLGRPSDAFKIMRENGLGISNKDLDELMDNN